MHVPRSLALLTLTSLVLGLLPGYAVAQPLGDKATIAGPLLQAGSNPGDTFDPDQYEDDDTPDLATALPLDGAPQTRTLHVPADNDWVYVDLEEGDRLHVFTTGECDTFMFLYGPDTRLMRRDDDSGETLNASINYAVRDTGRHYVRIVPFDNQLACPVYGLVGELLPPLPSDSFEDDNSASQGVEFALNGQTQERSIHTPGDEDWILLRLNPNSRLNVFTTGRCDTVLHLFGPDATTLLVDDDDSGVGLNADIEFAVADGGVYFVRARLLDPDETCESYGLSGNLLPPVRPDTYESDDGFATARPLVLDGNPQEHTFHINGDNDWVTFTLSPGDRVYLMTTGPCDTLLFLYGSDGTTLLRRDDDGGEDLNAAILYTALSGGTYFARVAPIARARGICEGYRLYGSRFPISAPTPSPVVTAVATPATTPVTTPVVPSSNGPTAVPSPTRQRPPGF